jgi:hypothetical protein
MSLARLLLARLSSPYPSLPHLRAAVATASLLAAGAALIGLSSNTASQAQGVESQSQPSQGLAPSGRCEEAAGFAFLPAPLAPWKGAPLRVIVAAEKPFEGELLLVAPNGSVAARSGERHGGPPYFWFAEVASPAAGTWRARLDHDGGPAGCGPFTRDIAVRPAEPPRPHAADGSLWPIHNAWNRTTEGLFSAWIEKLFDAPLDAEPSWPALHMVLRDRSRNFLFNYLGLGEDQMGLVIRPDCADLPYFLRAYFAFKIGLPFGYSKCSRGGGGHPPKCFAWWNIQNLEVAKQLGTEPGELADGGAPERAPSGLPPGRVNGVQPAAVRPPPPPAWAVQSPAAAKRLGLAMAFGQYLQGPVADGVHSGTGRTLATDDNTDYYPVPLKEETLRPGTVYADPYGHILMISRRIAQSDDAAGIIFAVDAQPDGTVARKRFWRGNFLFAQDPALGSPGFKRFRPLVRDKNGALRRLTNAEISKDPQYADFSLDQTRLAVEDFYDRMEDVMSPSPLDPLRAMKETIAALEEQVKARVTSVENGRKFQSSGRGDADMPEGATIFETTGAWEDFSTPSRDLRLLIAIDVVRGYPDRVARRPERYAMPQGKSVAAVKAELEGVLASELAARKFSYTRSDGSAWTLALRDIVDRASALEMAYNPNDCVELRWGAAEKSDEASTCRRHASALQHGRMTEYRAWFHDRRRPPRA